MISTQLLECFIARSWSKYSSHVVVLLIGVSVVDPFNSFAVLPLASSLNPIHININTSPMLLPVLPVPLIPPTVIPHKDPIPMLFVVLVVPLVLPPILPYDLPLAVHLVPISFTFVPLPIGPFVDSASVDIVEGEVPDVFRPVTES